MAGAQARLREVLGRDVRFYGPAEVIYDPSIPQSAFDDEGIPLDPLASGTASNAADVELPGLALIATVRGNVVFQPLAAMRRDMTEEQVIGFRSRLNKDLILDISDRQTVDAASHFEIGTLARDSADAVITPEQWTPDDGELWKIVNAKSDGFGALSRYIVFGQGTR